MNSFRPLLAALLTVIALFAFGILLTGGNRGSDGGDQAAAGVSDPGRIGRVTQVFQRFVARHALTGASLAIGRGGDLVHGDGVGRAADAPAPVAGLSMAVTGVCLAELFRDRGLPLDTTLGDLSERLSAVRVTPPAHARDLRIWDILTHTSGLEPDITQGNMLSPGYGTAGLHRRIAFLAMNRTAMRGTQGQFFFNNGNYAILGAVIEAVSGRDYAPFCAGTVLAPAGIAGAHMTGRLAALSSFAGWDMSAEDHVRFLMTWFTPDRPWVGQAEAGAGVQYGLGMYRSDGDGEPVFSHTGSICTDGARDGFGSAALVFPASWAISANWSGCVQDEAIAELIADLTAAVQ